MKYILRIIAISVIFIIVTSISTIPLFATSSATIESVSNTQIVIKTITDTGVNCTYRVSELLPNLFVYVAPGVNDVNNTLFLGSNSDARSNALITNNGHVHYMFIGTRSYEISNSDNHYYSRGLANVTNHFIGITCGGDPEIILFQATSNIQLGNTKPENSQFDGDARNPIGYATPTIDWNPATGKGKVYVDAKTGTKLMPWTFPRYPLLNNEDRTLANEQFIDDSGTWAIAFPAATNTTTSNPIFAQMVRGNTCPQFFNCTQGSANSGTFSGYDWDDLQVTITADGAGVVTNGLLGITCNGLDSITPFIPIVIPAASTAIVFPTAGNAPKPQFVDWFNTPTSVLPTPPNSRDCSQVVGTVNTNGTQVILQNSINAGGAMFNPKWKNGTRITINGTPFIIASVQDFQTLTLTASAGVQNNVPFNQFSYGVLIKKTVADAAKTMHISSVSFNTYSSMRNFMPVDGGIDFINPTQVTDSGGAKWYIADHVGNNLFGQRYVLPVDPFATNPPTLPRFLNSNIIGATGIAPDNTGTTLCGIFTNWLASNPNDWFCNASNATDGSNNLIRRSYLPNAVTSMPADYNEITPAMGGFPFNTNVSGVTNVTPPSLGREPAQQAILFDATFNKNLFGSGGFAGFSNNRMLWDFQAQQNSLGWMGCFDTTNNYLITGLTNSYGKSTKNGRWCGDHNITAITDGQGAVFWVGAFLATSSNTGFGPYIFTSSTTLTNAPGANCIGLGVTDLYVLTQVPFGQGCNTISIDRIAPCRNNPSALEVAQMTDCAFAPGTGKVQLQNMREGDVFLDNIATGEPIMVAKVISPTSIIVLRNWQPPQGYQLLSPAGVISNHTATWTSSMSCNGTSGSSDGSNVVWNFDTNPSGDLQVSDFPYTPSAHSDVRNGIFGGLGQGFFNGDQGFVFSFFYALRTGWSSTVNQLPTTVIKANPSFGGNIGCGSPVCAGSHNGLSRNPNNPKYFLDGAPWTNTGSAGLFLWNQGGVTNPTGTLYKIPKASVVFQGGANVFPAMRRTQENSVWSGNHLIQDASNTVCDGTASGNWKYWVIDYSTLDVCGQAGQAVGDVFVNIPGSVTSFRCGDAFNYNNLCFATPGAENNKIIQVAFPKLGTSFLGEYERALTDVFAPNGAMYTFANAQGSANDKFFVTNSSFQGHNSTASQLMIGKLPPLPNLDTINRSMYYPFAVQPGGVAGSSVRVRFGYVENGLKTDFNCISRKESCVVPASVGINPFNFIGETAIRTSCGTASGCTIIVPVAIGRVVWYEVDRFDGVSETRGGLQFAGPFN